MFAGCFETFRAVKFSTGFGYCHTQISGSCRLSARAAGFCLEESIYINCHCSSLLCLHCNIFRKSALAYREMTRVGPAEDGGASISCASLTLPGNSSSLLLATTAKPRFCFPSPVLSCLSCCQVPVPNPTVIICSSYAIAAHELAPPIHVKASSSPPGLCRARGITPSGIVTTECSNRSSDPRSIMSI